MKPSEVITALAANNYPGSTFFQQLRWTERGRVIAVSNGHVNGFAVMAKVGDRHYSVVGFKSKPSQKTLDAAVETTTEYLNTIK